MAIYIQIQKADESPRGITYDFGPSDRFIGQVFVDRTTHQVSLVRIDDAEKQEFYLSRVQRALQRHLQAGEFPQSTCYAA
jgi:hypothetical protein